jgi:hypothetical protein
MFERFVLFPLTTEETVDIEPLAIRQYIKHHTFSGYRSITNAVHRRYRIQLQTVPVMSSLFWGVSRCKFFFDCLAIQDETDILSRNVGDHLPTYAAPHARRAQAPSLSTLRRKPGISHLSVAFQMKKIFYVNTIQLCWSDTEIDTIYIENAQLMEKVYWD